MNAAYELSSWLKSTVPGIIVLGAIGSVAAYILIEIVKKLGRRLLLWATVRVKSAGKWLLATNLRPFARSVAAIAKYAATDADPTKLVVWATSTYTTFRITLALFCIALVATVAISIQLGFSSPALLGFMAGVTGLILIFLIKDFAAVLAVYFILFYRDLEEVDQHLKANDNVLFFSGLVVVLDAALTTLKKRKKPGEEGSATDVAQKNDPK